jgi:hypothetical protein
MNPLEKAIGGYFELELSSPVDHLYPAALTFQSARATFYALLDAGKPNRVWMPKYICDAMLSPLYALGIEIVFYDLTKQLNVDDSITLATNDWLLYVNYFGICNEQEIALLKRFNPSQVILDHSQAFYTPPLDCLATIYSPRKFFGIPDGGLLVTQIPITKPTKIDEKSISRCMHLLQRLDSTPESGYEAFKLADISINDIQPRKMSNLTSRILSSIDYESVRKKRNTNFYLLHEKFEPINELKININSINAPMCYPLLINDTTVKKRLLENRIFVATYWPDVRDRVNINSFEYKLMERCLPIPCDQRYSDTDLKQIFNFFEQLR